MGNSRNGIAFIKSLFWESSALVGTNNTRFQVPLASSGKMWAARTDALQPQPLPPECVSCVSPVKNQKSAVLVNGLDVVPFFPSEDQTEFSVPQPPRSPVKIAS